MRVAMKSVASLLMVFLIASTVGCSGLMIAPGAPGQTAARDAAVPKQTNAAVRAMEADAYGPIDAAADERLDKQEREALVAVKLTLGKEKWSESAPAPIPAAQTIAALRKAGVKLRLEPSTNPINGQQNDDLLALKEPVTERVQTLARKQVEQGRLSRAEQREMQGLTKNAFKLADLHTQIARLGVAASTANANVQTSSLQEMLRVAQMVRARKLYAIAFDEADYALVKRALERQKRAEAIAATTMALLAAFQAVLDGGDAKALDVIANGTLEAFPIQPSVTDDDAKHYVVALGENVSKVKARYEAQLRKGWGDAKYDKSFKAGVDAMFQQAETAQNQKSFAEMRADRANSYKEDVARCMRGEDVGQGSLAYGSCSDLARAARTGDTSDLPPGALEAFKENGGRRGAARTVRMPVAPPKAPVADADGALDAASKAFPSDGTIGASIQGISALRKGDAKGAIGAALSFVPVPGLKKAFGVASALLFAD
jgi:hypothetical protein